MVIEELTRSESLDLLARARLGRLACAQENQPYIVPFNFVYDDEYLYGFSTAGQKIDWMRANPLVCVEIDEIVSARQWVSIILFGCYEELPDTSELRKARRFAYELLRRNPTWWEPGYTKTILQGGERPLVPLYFRIRVLRISGHRATRDTPEQPDTRISMTGSKADGWFQKILRRIRDRFLILGATSERAPDAELTCVWRIADFCGKSVIRHTRFSSRQRFSGRPARPPPRQQDPEQSIPETETGATGSAALQHGNLMAQRDHFEHQLGAAAGFVETTETAVGVAMRAAYRGFEITNQSRWTKF